MRVTKHKLHSNRPLAISRVPLLTALLLFCLSFALRVTATDAPHAPQSSLRAYPHAPSQFALADFDGDSRPDLATVEVGQGTSLRTRYWVAFQLSNGSRSALGITAPTGGLQITSRDVNGDDFPDVIVTTAWTNRPVAVLLNDGFGNFTESSPSAFPAAFSNSEILLAASSPTIPDTSIGFSLRYPSGECDHAASACLPHNLSALLPSARSLVTLQFFVVSFLGRAPPSFVLS